jgi:hypothetical protein
MLAICDHCGRRNDVPDSAENREALCQKCGEPFFVLSERELAANRRATKLLLAAVLLFFALIVLLLFSRSGSTAIKAAQRTLVGGGLAQRLSGIGTGGSAEDNLPDALATNVSQRANASIGRLGQTIGERKFGDEVRAGAAGTDNPAARVGNSPSGQVTNAPSAGGNPGNSDLRNSVETPDGEESIVGDDAGSESTRSTNARSSALLLDDFSERLRQAGARSGDVQVSLAWANANDLDLHVFDPSGERIFYNNPISASGGHLDVDMNAQAPLTARPVENVYWPERGAPRGAYKVEVVHFTNHGARDPTAFTVRVVIKGQTQYYRGFISHVQARNRRTVAVCTFTVQ